MRVPRFIAVLLLAGCLAFGLASCSGGDDGGETGGTDTTAAQEETGGVTLQPDGEGEDGAGEEASPDDGETGEDSAAAGEEDAEGPARSKEIDELLSLHPIFPTKRFMNFAARGNPGACSLLSAKGSKAMRAAHGAPCEETIRTAAAGHDEPGLVIDGEFVPVDDFSDLEYLTTIFVLEREQARITIGNKRPPFRLSQYGRIWLLDSVPLTEVGTIG